MKRKTLISIFCFFVLFCFCSGSVVFAKDEVKVRSEKITGAVWHFDFQGKRYISIGDSKQSIQIGYQAYHPLMLSDNKTYTVLVRKGMGAKDDWIYEQDSGEYKEINGKAILIANLEYHKVKLNGEQRNFRMRKALGAGTWKIALTDGKVYQENKNGVLKHVGYESLRKVYYQDKELYIKMKKDLSSNTPWKGKYDGKILVSDSSIARPIVESAVKKKKPAKKKKYKGIPDTVISNGDGNKIELSKFLFDKGRVTINYEDKNEKPFTFVVLFQYKNQALAVYSDQKTTQSIHSSGQTLLSSSRLEKKGTENKGSLSIKVQPSVYGVYDLDFTIGMVSVFAMKGTVDDVLSKALDDQIEFKACSNVLVKFLSGAKEKKSTTSTVEQTIKTVEEAQKTASSVQQTIQSVQETVKSVQKGQKDINENKKSAEVSEVKTEPIGKSYELTEIRFYERGSGSVKRSDRKYTDSFFQDSARYIFIELNFKNFYYNKSNHSHKAQRVWYNPDGSIWNKHDFTIEAESDWDVFWHASGRGWSNSGNWPLGEYLVAIYVDNKKIGEKKYNIIKKGFEFTRIDFFEHGSGTPEVSERKYSRRFHRASTRFLNTEIHFKNLLYEKKDQEYKISRVWYNTKDVVERIREYDLIIKSDWKKIRIPGMDGVGLSQVSGILEHIGLRSMLIIIL